MLSLSTRSAQTHFLSGKAEGSCRRGRADARLQNRNVAGPGSAASVFACASGTEGHRGKDASSVLPKGFGAGRVGARSGPNKLEAGGYWGSAAG